EWYRYFMEAKKPYLLYVDTDASQNWSLSVFVNTAVYDDDNSVIGVCGVAVDMQDMQRLLERYERIYDIKINLVNDEGLIQVDTDTEKIERDSAHIDNLSAFSDGECYFEILPHGSRTITYLENLGWYLVIQNDEGRNKQVGGLIVPCIICIVICLAAAMLAIILGSEKKQKPDEVIRLSSSENNNEKQNK
ncbi:MAG: cache domain-containing protein, partial [Oscillospiraceae bacterium]|nr:cache domain-containing protein [Oscillospiraceae bacterium]